MNDNQESIAIANRPRDYAGLLWIFFASALGFSLFCATSAIALSDPTLPTPIVIERGDIADLAFSNLNTAAALTAEAFQVLVATSTPTATFTSTSTETASPTSSPTRTPFIPSNTPTKPPERQPTIVLPTNTRTPRPTNTAIVISPITGTPVVTEPPTETPVPEPSDTPEPPPPPTSTP